MRVRATAKVEAVAPEEGEGLIEFLKAIEMQSKR
jgi:hypothetical protein